MAPDRVLGEEAAHHFRVTRGLWAQIGMGGVGDAEAFRVSAFLLARGRAEDAARVLGAIGAAIAGGPVAADDARLQAAERQYIAPVRAALGAEAFAAAWADGCALGLDGVIAGVVAAAETAHPPAAPAPRRPHIPASGRQFTVTGSAMYHVRGGQITRAWAEFDSLALLQQIGALPAPAGANA